MIAVPDMDASPGGADLRATLERVTGDPEKPYARAVIATGPLVYASGQTPMRNGAIEGDDVAAQTRATLRNLADVLRDSGTTLEHVVRCSVFLADLEHLAAFNEAYAAAFGGHLPARTAVGAKLPGYLVEIDCIAALPAR